MLELHAGKRYWFPLNNYTDRKKSGLFTGEFDKDNGNAILMAKNGDTWSIPVCDLYLSEKDVKRVGYYD